MNVGQPGMDRSKNIDDQHHLRLKTLLDGLVGDNAASRSTAGLDVGQRTLTARSENERLTRRMRVAPDRALLAGDVAEVAGKGEGRRLS